MVDVKQRVEEIKRLHDGAAVSAGMPLSRVARGSPLTMVAKARVAMQAMANRQATTPVGPIQPKTASQKPLTTTAAKGSSTTRTRQFEVTYTVPGSAEQKTIGVSATDLKSIVAAVETQIPGATVLGAVAATGSLPTAARKGPGDYLHDAIRRWIGASPSPDCACKARIAQMNTWGTAGCREHLDEIVGWLENEAQKRGWWRYAVAVPGSRYLIRQMVLGAIEESEKAKQAAKANQEQTEKSLSDPLTKGT